MLVAGDGVFSVRSALGIDLVDLKSGTNRTLVSLADVKDVRVSLSTLPLLYTMLIVCHDRSMGDLLTGPFGHSHQI